MDQLLHNLAGWARWLATGDNLALAIGTAVAIASAAANVLQRLGFTRQAAALRGAAVEVEAHKAAAQQQSTALVATARGLNEALRAGHLDGDTFAKVTKTIQAYNLEAGTEETVLAPIVAAVRAGAEAAVVARTSTARLVSDHTPTPGRGTVVATDGSAPTPPKETAP